MSNESTRVYFFAQSTEIVPMRSQRLTAARKAAASVLLCALMLFGSACDDNNGSNGSKKSAAVKIETRPVDLPPGQTTAEMAWEPSAGPVTGYFVFTSRNGASFQFEQTTPGPNATISGEAGDELRIVVVALSQNGSLSDTSPPSAPFRFHPETEEPAPVAAATSLFDRPTAVLALGSNDGSGSNFESGSDGAGASPYSSSAETYAETQVADRADPEDLPAVEDVPAVSAEEAPRKADLLERLLNADARLAPRGRSNAADAWVQSFVDEEIAAGVAFVGTGNVNSDGMRELVWRDSSGQLFVSDGQAFLSSEDRAGTLIEAIRLQTNERFVAFDDLGGDAGSQWLIEDMLTGEVFVAPADASSTRDGIMLNRSRADLRLVGLGDFDGNGRGDLLWRRGENAEDLAFGRAASGWIPVPGSEISVPEDRRADLPLAIADLNGDGRDDLLSRDWNGRLRMTFFMTGETLSSDSVEAFWAGGADASTVGLELAGTLDLDRDGDAEIAWIGDEGLQIWDASKGPESVPEF